MSYVGRYSYETFINTKRIIQVFELTRALILLLVISNSLELVTRGFNDLSIYGLLLLRSFSS